MNKRDQQKYDIYPISSVDAEEASALLASAMGEGYGREKSARLWNWKHRENPAGSSLGCAAYSKAGELVGLRPFMCWNLIDPHGTQISAVRAVDTAVRSDWRGAGLFSQLTREALRNLDEEGIALVFNTPNENSAPGYAKMGWRLMGHPRLWVRPRIGRTVCSLFRGNEKQESVLDGRPGVHPVGDCLARVSSMAGSTADSARVSVRRDEAFLRWRYEQHPNLFYSVVETPGASAILREDRRSGRRGVALVDWFAEADPDRARRVAGSVYGGLLAEVRRKTRGDYLVTGPLSDVPLRLAAFAHGYLPLRWRAVTFAARPVRADGSDPMFADRSRWALTLGDLETF